MENIKNLILQAIDSGESVNLPYTPIKDIESTLSELGFNTKEPGYDNTNGWYIDFWLIYYLNNEQYQLSGSWWSGNYVFKKMKD